jgi:putative CocE/NonD family hydrolase
MRRLFLSVSCVVAVVLAVSLAPMRAQQPPPGAPAYDVQAHYQKSEVDVPMRDGVKLHTTVYAPKRADSSGGAGEKLPILLLRTPYGTGPYGDEYRRYLGPSPHSHEFEEEGFIFVFQDVRGKYKSEGSFTVMRPHNPGKKGTETDESSDTYDTIDWLVKNLPNNNGRVGMHGVSYPGFQVVHGLIDSHPALKAASPQASPSDMWLGDDFHHNGAFRLTYTFSWLSGSARARKGPSETDRGVFDPGTPDGYRFFMDLGPVANANKLYFHDQVPEWNSYMQHPDYDAYWEKQNMLPYLKNISIPVLNVAAWFDAEDFYGPMTIYRAIEKLNPANKSTLVVGPWSHGGWNGHPDGRSLGNIQFDEATATYFRQEVQLPFFRYHLKNKGTLNLPEVLAFETGANKWRSLDSWPHHTAAQAKQLYFQAGGKLSFAAPVATAAAAGVAKTGGAGVAAGYDSYVSDPNKPVPFSAETRFTQGHLWMLEDQRFAATRPDVLVYETEELKDDVVISGPIQAKLFVSSSGTDSDFIVKLIDVYPGTAKDNDPNAAGVRMGHFQMLISGEVFRAKYRESYAKPKPLVANQPTPLTINLPDRNHRFLKGHRIMVQVQSSWFPVIDRNPQVFTNIYAATESDFHAATQRVYRSGARLSHLEVPVVQ